VVGEGEIDEVRALARHLQGFSIQHVNSARVGGGVAEILAHELPLMNELGLETRWDVLSADPSFYEVTKTLHNMLHGGPGRIDPGMVEVYRSTMDANAGLVRDDADLVLIHDPQPAGLIRFRKRRRRRWIWRCHIDLSRADMAALSLLRSMVEEYDAAVFHLPQYTQDLMIPQHIMPPAIDPLSPKNEELSMATVRELVEGLGIDPRIPIVLQVSRFDRLKDPVGVIEAFRLASGAEPGQLVLAGGGADDDPEGAEVLAEVRDRASRVPGVTVLELPPDRHREINALQRAATVVVQKSVREGFGLVVTEAMWKGKAVIGTAVGGIREQIIPGLTGFLVYSTEGMALRIRQLLGDPELAARMGENARENVRTNYLLPTAVKRWLATFLVVRQGARGITHLGAPGRKRASSPRSGSARAR
jgi:trehalose synthase